MLRISRDLSIDENDIQISFVRASGPGGQNVNKLSTAAQLRFDTRKITLPEDAGLRLTTPVAEPPKALRLGSVRLEDTYRSKRVDLRTLFGTE